MPLSGAERTRRYRERLKEDPEKLEIQRKKNLERIKSTKKKITELTLEEAEIRRENWKKYKRTSRMKKHAKIRTVNVQNEKAAPKDNYTSQDTDVKPCCEDKKKVEKLRKKRKFLANKCRRFIAYNKLLKTQKETNRKRYQRTKAQMEKEINCLNEQINKLTARQEILESTITRTYQSCKSVKEKKTFQKLVKHSENKRLVTNMLGMKGKFREKARKIRRSDIAEITKFFIRDDMSRNTSGKKETRTKCKEKVQIRYLLDTLVNTFKKYKTEGGRYGFTTFYKHKPHFVLSPGLSLRSTCLCIKHSNFGFLHTAMIRHGLVTGSTQEIMSKVSCDTDNYVCMMNKCRQCKDKNVTYEVTNDDKLGEQVEWSQWERVDHIYQKNDGQTTKEIRTKKTAKVTKTGTLNDLKKQYEKDLIMYKKHHFNMVHQQAQYQKAIKNLKQNEALIVCDFSENYDAKLANQVQSMHYGASNRQISLHTGMVFWKDRTQSFCTISDDINHQPPAIWAHLKPIIDMIKQETPDTTVIHFFSDGPSSQYRQKKNFYLLGYFTDKYALNYTTWSFYESGHGKNVADGIGGSVKRTLDRKVCHGNDVVDGHDAYHLLKETLKITKVFLIPSCEIYNISNILPSNLPVLKGTMQLHQVITSQDGIPFKIKYRDISCFCGDLRGQCECFLPQLHFVTPDSISEKEISTIIDPSTSSGLTDQSLVEQMAEDVTGDDKNETVCEPHLPLDLLDICLKPFTDTSSEAIDVDDVTVFPLGEENELLLWSDRDDNYQNQPTTDTHHNENEIPVNNGGVSDKKLIQAIVKVETRSVERQLPVITVPIEKDQVPEKRRSGRYSTKNEDHMFKNISVANNILIQAVEKVETRSVRRLLPDNTVPIAKEQVPQKRRSGRYSTKKEDHVFKNKSVANKIQAVKKVETRSAERLLPDITVPIEKEHVPEQRKSGRYTRQTCKPKIESITTMLECKKCLTSILGRKGKCMVCKKWYCAECIDGDFGFDYICDPCLEG